jgi:hypothetical protein
MPSAGFEPVIPAMEQTQAYALDRGATRIGWAEMLTLWAATFGHSANKEKGKNVEGDGLDRFLPFESQG